MISRDLQYVFLNATAAQCISALQGFPYIHLFVAVSLSLKHIISDSHIDLGILTAIEV